MSFIPEAFGKIMALIYSVVPSFGLTIIIFGIITRLLLVPFNIKQIKSSRVMMKIQPKVKEIQKRYASDRQTMQRKLMELYSENDYHPMAGCLPTIIQFILIIGMFNALRNPGVYVFTDPAVLKEATNQFFLWIPNISMPDLLSNVISKDILSFSDRLPGLLPIATAILTYCQMAYAPMMSSSKSDNDGNSRQQQPDTMTSMNKTFKIVLPILFLIYGVSFDAGIVIYWTVGTIFQIIQQFIVNRILDKQEAEKLG